MPSARWPFALALCANLFVAGALIAATRAAIGGPFVFALDDAYIHLAVARTLAESGTWGVNPGEFASASSSPLWTVLLAVTAHVTDALPEAALTWNAVAAGLVLWLADQWLRDEAIGPGARFGALLLLSATVPLPFLVCLGMEHTLHLALVLALLRTGCATIEARDVHRRRLVALAALAGAACLVRYESVFVVGWLAFAALFEPAGPRWRGAGALTAGGLGAIAAFGLWSVSQGGLPLPHALYTKALLGRDWWGSLRAALFDGAGVVALAVAVGTAGASARSPRLRRYAWLFPAIALTHLLLARVGWLYRYEAWLVGCGVWIALQLRPRPSPQAALAGAALALPLGYRAVDAFAVHPPAARLQSDADDTVARWIAQRWPTATIAVHDLGAIAWRSDATLVDVVGLGTTAVTRLQVEGRLSRDALGALVRERGVTLAVTGRSWHGGDLPDAFTEVARLWAPYPSGPGEFETVIWSVDPASHADVLASLSDLEALLPPRARLERAGEAVVPLASVELVGAAVAAEPDRIAFYTNGEARFVAPLSGTLLLTAHGSEADGRGPLFTVGETAISVGGSPHVAQAGPVRAGETVRVLYTDDTVDGDGNDRNLYIERIAVRPP